MGSRHKVFGGPLQAFYRRLLHGPEGPNQPELLKILAAELRGQGLVYHPRTLKRQLLGNIRYIPETLESLLLQWARRAYPKFFPQLLKQYEAEKAALEKQADGEFFVSPQFFTRMADAYLLIHKALSRRQLALRLAADLKKQGNPLGLETLQSALAGKTLKIRKVVEDQLRNYFLQDGCKNAEEIRIKVEGMGAQAPQEIQKVRVENITELADAYLLKTEGLSKRGLALTLQKLLEKKGYRYHLSSLQSILEGKTRRTRQVVLDTLREIFGTTFQDFAASLDPQQLQWGHYVDAPSLPDLVGEILGRHPVLSRRQLALRLKEDLAEKNFHFSLNTLQFILGGKTRRTKRVVLETLQNYLNNGTFKDWAPRPTVRLSLENRVVAAHQKLQAAAPGERLSIHRSFLLARAELIRKRWLKKNRSTPAVSRRRSRWSDLQEPGEKDLRDGSLGNEEVLASWSFDEPLGRLVS